jgi:ethanolamine utilization microcompartment shell protein EutS
MKKLRIPRLLADSRSNRLALGAVDTDIEISLEKGQNTFITEPVNIDHLLQSPGRNILTSVSIQYEYLDNINAIKLASANYTGERANKLTISEGDNEIGVLNTGLETSTEFSKLFSPDMQTQISECLKDHTNQVIKNARTAGLIVLERHDMPVALKKKSEKLQYVFRKGRMIKEYAPGEKVETGDKIVSLGSILGGPAIWDGPVDIWNVIGSGKDTNPEGDSWIDFWIDAALIYAPHFFPDVFHGRCVTNRIDSHTVSGNLLGGHVVLSPEHIVAPYGVSEIVFILPICPSCNNYHVPVLFDEMGNVVEIHGDITRYNYSLNRTAFAVWLEGYLT